MFKPHLSTTGVRPLHTPPRDTTTSEAVLAGDACCFCLKDTGPGDRAIMKKKTMCVCYLYSACYKHHWNETKQYLKYICRFCAACGQALRNNVVGEYSACNADMDLACARKVDCYCIVCHHAIWPEQSSASA